MVSGDSAKEFTRSHMREYYCSGCKYYATRKEACKKWNVYIMFPEARPCHEWIPRDYKNRRRPYNGTD